MRCTAETNSAPCLLPPGSDKPQRGGTRAVVLREVRIVPADELGCLTNVVDQETMCSFGSGMLD
jgi:hypothetical protein